MTMYWVYDLPTWLFGTVTVIGFVAFGLAGLYILRGWVQRIDNGHHAYNHISVTARTRNENGMRKGRPGS